MALIFDAISSLDLKAMPSLPVLAPITPAGFKVVRVDMKTGQVTVPIYLLQGPGLLIGVVGGGILSAQLIKRLRAHHNGRH
jgi:hypothetical protein